MKGKINFRCDENVKKKFEIFIRERKLKRSAVLRKMLIEYLEKEGF